MRGLRGVYPNSRLIRRALISTIGLGLVFISALLYYSTVNYEVDEFDNRQRLVIIP